MADYISILNEALLLRNKNGVPFTIDEFKNLLGIHITIKHTGKMDGMASISTACICNFHCINHRKIKGSICEYCFAERSFRMYSDGFEKCFVNNYEILTKAEIPVELMPVLNYSIFRIESFGDVDNEIQAKNYWNLITANPYTQFGWWTKNYGIVKKVFDKFGKPSNVKLILSSIMLNEEYDISKFHYADKVFTVYSKDYIKENGIDINCGGNKCITCQRCYRDNEYIYIREKKK